MAYTTINKSTDYFNTKLYTGNGGTQSITGVGFQPDLTWVKGRSNASWHRLTDAVRGVTKEIYSNDNAVEATNANGLTAFGTDGFSLGDSGDYNSNGWTFASWNWKAGGAGSSNTEGSITSNVSANTTAGFSIVSYTGTGSTSTAGHGLNSTPEIIISKSRNTNENWAVHTTLIDGSMDFLRISTTDAKGDSGHAVPTSTLFTTRANNNYITYLFHSVKGYSKMGTYTGNGNADGTFVYTGFKPAFILHKRTDNTSGWDLFDNKRLGYNVANRLLAPNNSDQEATSDKIDLLSNGFKLRTSTGGNYSGTYIYMAFAKAPLVGSNNIPCTAR